MVLFYARWLKNTDKEVQQTQIVVQDNAEDGGGLVVTTIRSGKYINKGAASVAGAMHIVSDIVGRLGEGA